MGLQGPKMDPKLIWGLKVGLWGPKFGLSELNVGVGGLKSELWGPKVGLQNPVMDPEDPRWVLGSQTSFLGSQFGLWGPKFGLSDLTFGFCVPQINLWGPHGFRPPPPPRDLRPQNAFRGP